MKWKRLYKPQIPKVTTSLLRYFIYLYFISGVCNVELCKILPLLNRFPKANDHRISTSENIFNIEVYSRSTWFHFELNLSKFSEFL